MKQVRQKILDQLVEKKIMHQEAEKAKISITDEEVEAAYNKIIERNKITPEMFKKELAAMGMSEPLFRENMKTQLPADKTAPPDRA